MNPAKPENRTQVHDPYWNPVRTNPQPVHESTETHDTGCHASRSPNGKILWTTFYVVLFLAFAVGLAWYCWPKFAADSVMIIVGCLLCLSGTIYLIQRYHKLSSNYGDIDHGYVPIFYSFTIGGVIPMVICLGMGALWSYLFTGRTTADIYIGANAPLWRTILASTILGGALPEETFKFLVYVSSFMFFGQEPNGDMMIRFMVLQATAAGMGFGIQEAVLYVTGMNGMLVGTLFRVVGVLCHSLLAYISGCWYVTKVLEASRDGSERNCCLTFLSSIWCSILIHAAWNTTVFILAHYAKDGAVYLNLLGTFVVLPAVVTISYYIGRARFRILKQTLAECEEQDQEKGLQQMGQQSALQMGA